MAITGYTVSPQKMLKSKPSIPMNVGNRIFVDDQVNIRSLVWALIQYSGCSYKKGKFGHIHTPHGWRTLCEDEEIYVIHL